MLLYPIQLNRLYLPTQCLFSLLPTHSLPTLLSTQCLFSLLFIKSLSSLLLPFIDK